MGLFIEKQVTDFKNTMRATTVIMLIIVSRNLGNRINREFELNYGHIYKTIFLTYAVKQIIIE